MQSPLRSPTHQTVWSLADQHTASHDVPRGQVDWEHHQLGVSTASRYTTDIDIADYEGLEGATDPDQTYTPHSSTLPNQTLSASQKSGLTAPPDLLLQELHPDVSLVQLLWMFLIQHLEPIFPRQGTPRRPMNSFLVFARHRRPILQKEKPSLKTGELSRELSVEWKNLPPDQKAFYNEQAKILKDHFHRRFPHYVYKRRPNNSGKKKNGLVMKHAYRSSGSSRASSTDSNSDGVYSGGSPATSPRSLPNTSALSSPTNHNFPRQQSFSTSGSPYIYSYSPSGNESPSTASFPFSSYQPPPIRYNDFAPLNPPPDLANAMPSDYNMVSHSHAGAGVPSPSVAALPPSAFSMNYPFPTSPSTYNTPPYNAASYDYHVSRFAPGQSSHKTYATPPLPSSPNDQMDAATYWRQQEHFDQSHSEAI